MFNQTCATRYVIRILVINAKQRQQTGKQNFPKCGAVSGFSLQNGIFPKFSFIYLIGCNGVQREHNKKLNNGLPILHKVPPK